MDPGDIATCLAPDHPGSPDDPAGTGGPAAPMATPIVQSATFAFPDFDALVAGLRDERGTTVYSRGRNPTVVALERKLAALERGDACTCHASGMAAISAVLLGLLEAGDHVVFVNHTYGPTLELAEQLRRFRIRHDVVLDGRVHAVEAALRPETRLVWLESPGTMLFRLADVKGIAALARDRGITTCLDNSWATPLFLKPLELGVDVVVHSASKYLGGHSDLMAGAVIADEARMARIFERAYMLVGGILAPFDAWLLLRGLKTLPTRMRQHHEDGLAVARFLRDHPAVRAVHHPAFDPAIAPGDAGLTGFASLFSFELRDGSYHAVRAVLDALRVFRLAVSWGGTESLAISPERGDNGSALEAAGLPRGLIRLSVGLEGTDALIADLGPALEALA